MSFQQKLYCITLIVFLSMSRFIIVIILFKHIDNFDLIFANYLFFHFNLE